MLIKYDYEPVPSSAPRNVLAIVTGTKSARFNWQPPPKEDHNGPILYYTLRIVEEEFNQCEIVVNTSSTSYEVLNLEEYIRYLCQVSAATESGNGPYSSPLMFITLQDGLLRNYTLLHYLYCFTHYSSNGSASVICWIS